MYDAHDFKLPQFLDFVQNYEAAKSLLETAHNLTKDFSFKLSKALQHEILYIELLQASDRQRLSGSRVAISNVTQRIHACLASAKSGEWYKVSEK